MNARDYVTLCEREGEAFKCMPLYKSRDRSKFDLPLKSGSVWTEKPTFEQKQ